MFPLTRILLVSVGVVSACLLAGCEPSPGRVLEEKSKRVGSLEFLVKRHAEGTWGNSARGEHYRSYCRSPYTKDLRNNELTVSYDYRTAPYFIKNLPINRIYIVDEKIAFGNVSPYDFFCVFDACATGADGWHISKLPPELQSDMVGSLDVDAVPVIENMIFLPPNGIRLDLNQRWFKNGRLVQVSTDDKCKTWKVIVNSAPLKN